MAVDCGPVDEAPKRLERAGPTGVTAIEPEVLLPDPTPRHEPISRPTNKLMESCQRTRRRATLNHTRAQVSPTLSGSSGSVCKPNARPRTALVSPSGCPVLCHGPNGRP